MPTLYCVPMIHAPQELGMLQNAVTAMQIKMYGEKKHKEHLKEIERYWQEVEQRIELAELRRPEIASRLLIFIDGLPNADEALIKKIVEELTLRQIPAYLVIKTLLENGARIRGTEDPGLLLQEYHYWTEISQGKKHDPKIAQELLQSRDQYIARRIISVVADEEFALLFIGRSHNATGALNQLSKKFTVVYL